MGLQFTSVRTIYVYIYNIRTCVVVSVRYNACVGTQSWAWLGSTLLSIAPVQRLNVSLWKAFLLQHFADAYMHFLISIQRLGLLKVPS